LKETREKNIGMKALVKLAQKAKLELLSTKFNREKQTYLLPFKASKV